MPEQRGSRNREGCCEGKSLLDGRQIRSDLVEQGHPWPSGVGDRETGCHRRRVAAERPRPRGARDWCCVVPPGGRLNHGFPKKALAGSGLLASGPGG
ncbi:MAG: hypothetical protein ACRENW_09050 [Thermodesulfobacteriota bacterium]